MDVKLSDKGCRSWDIKMILYDRLRSLWFLSIASAQTTLVLTPATDDPQNLTDVSSEKTKACGCEERPKYQKSWHQ